MNLELWNIFYEVACAQNISKASKKLHISQPAITKQIKNLEEKLDCKLFVRSQKGVFLTQEGKLVFEDIQKGLNSFQIAEKKLKADSELLIGTIRIGISTTLTKTYLMPYIQKFHQSYPNINFEISTDPTSILKDALKNGKIDFIIAKFPPKLKDDFSYDLLGYMKDIFIVNPDFKELLDKSWTLTELSHYPILVQKQPSSSRDCLELYCQENGIKMKSFMEIASSNLLIEFVKIGYGIGVVTREYVQREIEKKEIYQLNVIPEMPDRAFGIIHLNENYIPKCSKEFLKLLKKEDEKKK